jgi:hypothetical protein
MSSHVIHPPIIPPLLTYTRRRSPFLPFPLSAAFSLLIPEIVLAFSLARPYLSLVQYVLYLVPTKETKKGDRCSCRPRSGGDFVRGIPRTVERGLSVGWLPYPIPSIIPFPNPGRSARCAKPCRFSIIIIITINPTLVVLPFSSSYLLLRRSLRRYQPPTYRNELAQLFNLSPLLQSGPLSCVIKSSAPAFCQGSHLYFRSRAGWRGPNCAAYRRVRASWVVFESGTFFWALAFELRALGSFRLLCSPHSGLTLRRYSHLANPTCLIVPPQFFPPSIFFFLLLLFPSPPSTTQPIQARAYIFPPLRGREP